MRATVLQLRVYGESAAMAAVADSLDALDGLDGLRYLSRVPGGRRPDVIVTAEADTESADAVFGLLDRRGVRADDVVLAVSKGRPEAAADALQRRSARCAAIAQARA